MYCLSCCCSSSITSVLPFWASSSAHIDTRHSRVKWISWCRRDQFKRMKQEREKTTTAESTNNFRAVRCLFSITTLLCVCRRLLLCFSLSLLLCFTFYFIFFALLLPFDLWLFATCIKFNISSFRYDCLFVVMTLSVCVYLLNWNLMCFFR